MVALSKAKLGGIGLPSWLTKSLEDVYREKYGGRYPGLAENVASGVGTGLKALGLPKHIAETTGRNITSLAEDWTPAGALTAVEEYGPLGALAAVPVVGAKGKKLAKGLGEAAEHLPNVEKTASAVVDPVAPKGLGVLPSSQSLNTPRVPSVEDMAKARVETVPLSQVRGSQSKMQWERFNKGEFGEPIVKGFGDMPVAVRREDGEYIIFDGHHRAVKAMDEGKDALPMHVIDAKDYDPENAGRKSVKSDVDDDELLRELGAVDPVAPKGLGIRAYHGSPHSFEQFDISKIGTGEGAQAYGHGLYFAENEGVATDYRKKLAGQKGWGELGKSVDDLLVKMGATTPATQDAMRSYVTRDLDMMAGELDAAGGGLDAARSIVAQKGYQADVQDAMAQKLVDIQTTRKGHMYEVDIAADPEAFLDWDKPLSEHPENVQASLRSVFDKRYGKGFFDQYAAQGHDIREIQNHFDDLSEAELSGLLKAEGIPGIRYLDAGSRMSDEAAAIVKNYGSREKAMEIAQTRLRNASLGDIRYWQKIVDDLKTPESRNYVVFDPKIISIVRKYGIPAAIASGLITEEMGRQMQQQGEL